MTVACRAASLITLLLSAGFVTAGPQDPVKKAEMERKREEMKAKAERRRAEAKAKLERAKAAPKPAPIPASQQVATATPPKAAPKPKSAPNSYDEKSKQFRCPEGKFTVFMPVNPRQQDLHVMGVTMKMFGFQEREGAFAAAFADLPIPAGESSSKIQERLDGARDGMVRNVKGKLTGQTSINLQGKYPGREVRAEIPEMKGIIRARIYLVGPRLYQVAALGFPEWVNSKEATKFLDSLALTP